MCVREYVRYHMLVSYFIIYHHRQTCAHTEENERRKKNERKAQERKEKISFYETARFFLCARVNTQMLARRKFNKVLCAKLNSRVI